MRQSTGIRGTGSPTRTLQTIMLTHRSRRRLHQALAIFDALLSQLKPNASSKQWGRKVVVLHWQRTLVFCTLGRYAEAKKSLQEMKKHKDSLPRSFWVAGEEESYESRFLYLQGELALVENRKADAKACCEKSKAIDESLGDAGGVRENDKRLALC